MKNLYSLSILPFNDFQSNSVNLIKDVGLPIPSKTGAVQFSNENLRNSVFWIENALITYY